MILVVALTVRSLTVAIASVAGELVQICDATWRVGSGRSLAAAVKLLLVETGTPQDRITKLVVIDQGGSYTSARTTFAFVNALAWVLELPIYLVRAGSDASLFVLVRQALESPAIPWPIVPSYENS